MQALCRREGALLGAKEEEAFSVAVGRDTMTEDDILNGRLIMEIGIAPVRPAEFVVILEGLPGDAEASLVAAKLVDAIRAPMHLPDGTELHVTTSVGMACWNGTGEGAEDILDRADRALYRAKAAGRDTFAQTIF